MTILAAVDGDSKPDRVVTIGEDLANAYDDELVVVNVLSQDEFERRDEVHTKEQYTIEDGQNDASATGRDEYRRVGSSGKLSKSYSGRQSVSMQTISSSVDGNERPLGRHCSEVRRSLCCSVRPSPSSP